MKKILIVLSLFMGADAESANGIKNFAIVSPGIYRGALPNSKDVAYLKSIGVKTILNLQANEKFIEQERKDAEKNGIEFLSMPMSPSPTYRPSERRLTEILEIISDKRNYPIFVNCKKGMDRTGVMIGLYRVEVEGMDPKVAYKEMKKYGYHGIYNWGLNCAYWERTGMGSPKTCDLFRPKD